MPSRRGAFCAITHAGIRVRRRGAALAWLVGRALGGPVVGLVALGLLATSMPHILYAAEARFYSLYALATLANLAAFVALVRAPSTGRAALFTLARWGS